MPTVVTHAAVPLAIGLGLGKKAVSPRLMVAGIVAAMVPDLDTLGFKLGIAYGSQFGHRGFTHSLFFAGILAAIAAGMYRALQTTAVKAFSFVFLSAASHGLLDACTTGGRGVALLWPFSLHRYFAPVRFIRVSPIGIARFLSGRANAVLLSELLWVWIPMALLGFFLLALRRSTTR
jgi:inner membrane protein